MWAIVRSSNACVSSTARACRGCSPGCRHCQVPNTCARGAALGGGRAHRRPAPGSSAARQCGRRAAAARLVDDQHGVALHVQPAHAQVERGLEAGQQPVVFGHVVGRVAQRHAHAPDLRAGPACSRPAHGRPGAQAARGGAHLAAGPGLIQHRARARRPRVAPRPSVPLLPAHAPPVRRAGRAYKARPPPPGKRAHQAVAAARVHERAGVVGCAGARSRLWAPGGERGRRAGVVSRGLVALCAAPRRRGPRAPGCRRGRRAGRVPAPGRGRERRAALQIELRLGRGFEAFILSARVAQHLRPGTVWDAGRAWQARVLRRSVAQRRRGARPAAARPTGAGRPTCLLQARQVSYTPTLRPSRTAYSLLPCPLRLPMAAAQRATRCACASRSRPIIHQCGTALHQLSRGCWASSPAPAPQLRSRQLQVKTIEKTIAG